MAVRRWILGFALAGCGIAPAQFVWKEGASRTLELTEGGKPVFTYRHGKQLGQGVAPRYRRCCYIHPLVAPNGAVVTDDFPADHFHHRGLGWMWPVVEVEGQRYDMWVTGPALSNQTEMYSHREGRTAGLWAEDGWYLNGKKIVRERVQISVPPLDASGRRQIDFVLTWEALRPGIRLSGMQDGKGYGGFNIRFAPRTETVVNSEHTPRTKDSNLEKNAWAELRGKYAGGVATVRITPDPGNPGEPNAWCLRNYGFLGVNFPGLDFYTLEPGKPLVMKYRVTVTGE